MRDLWESKRVEMVIVAKARLREFLLPGSVIMKGSAGWAKKISAQRRRSGKMAENGLQVHLAPMLSGRGTRLEDTAFIVSFLGVASVAGRLLLG